MKMYSINKYINKNVIMMYKESHENMKNFFRKGTLYVVFKKAAIRCHTNSPYASNQ